MLLKMLLTLQHESWWRTCPILEDRPRMPKNQSTRRPNVKFTNWYLSASWKAWKNATTTEVFTQQGYVINICITNVCNIFINICNSGWSRQGRTFLASGVRRYQRQSRRTSADWYFWIQGHQISVPMLLVRTLPRASTDFYHILLVFLSITFLLIFWCRVAKEFLDDPDEGFRASYRNTQNTERNRAEGRSKPNKTARLRFLALLSSEIPLNVTIIFINLCSWCTAHPERNAFRDMNFGGNRNGIFMAAGPDRMHLMYEGIGKHIHTWLCTLLIRVGKSFVLLFLLLSFLITMLIT
jgi:hypothetical protein